MEQFLKVRGARQHNLKNINLDIPKGKLVIFTGLSGSGKSSLAFDTIYAEGQRRYVESLSSYARQFLGIMDKPDVDAIVGLSPAISIDQKSTSHNPRSTVGTVTEIYDYLRLLFARVGHPHCPNCTREISRQSPQEIVEQIFLLAQNAISRGGSKQFRFLLLSPVVRDRKGEFSGLFENLRAKGYRRVRVDGSFFALDEDLVLIKTNKHTIEVVVDTISLDKQSINQVVKATARSRITDDVEQALSLSDGLVVIAEVTDASFVIPDRPKRVRNHLFSEKFSCPLCNISIGEIEPRTFSFNSPHGACTTCSGIGNIVTVDPTLVLRENLTITEGGILPYAKMFENDTWGARVVRHIAKSIGIDIRKPLINLTKEQKEILLYGTGETIHEVFGPNRFGDMTAIHEVFRGIIPELLHRYQETESEYVRSDIEKYMRQEICKTCKGKRLKKESLTVTVDGLSIADLTDFSITHIISWVDDVIKTLNTQTEKAIATPILKEIHARLTFLDNVGLEYLTISRSATTLSGGEAQRIRLASQIGSGLSGVLYVLDEPSIGLHQRDNKKLIETLKKLRDLGNTVIVVEHDREMMQEADYIFDFGPGAGKHGGTVIAQGTPNELMQSTKSLTAKYLNNTKVIHRSRRDLIKNGQAFVLLGASENNLKNITVSFPLHRLICVTGVSGSGKSTLVVETLHRALSNHFNPMSKLRPGKNRGINGLENLDKVILIDQSPIGRTPRSNPATYTGIFTYIRDLYAQLHESKFRGYKAGRFSFNVKGGRCEACEGEGQKKIEMQFLSDIYVTCEICNGARYNSETLEVVFHGKTVANVLDMTAEEALGFFANQPILHDKLKTIVEVGLGYIHLGQPAPTLSGGEAQRVKLASELGKRATGKTVYILDEPTTGLHFADLEKLLMVLHKLTELGNTVIIIEHNLDIVKNADWIIDLGPAGGDGGGYLIAEGSPLAISKNTKSHTGRFLTQFFS